MTGSIRPWTSPIAASATGLIAGGVGAQLFRPLLRAVDPLGLTPIALIGAAGGAVIVLYVRRGASRRPSSKEV